MKGPVLTTAALLMLGPAWAITPLPPNTCQHPKVIQALERMIRRDQAWVRATDGDDTLIFQHFVVAVASRDLYSCRADALGWNSMGGAEYIVTNDVDSVNTTLVSLSVEPRTMGAAERSAPWLKWEALGIYVVGLPLLLLMWFFRVALGAALKGVKYGAEAFIAVRVLQHFGIVKRGKLP